MEQNYYTPHHVHTVLVVMSCLVSVCVTVYLPLLSSAVSPVTLSSRHVVRQLIPDWSVAGAGRGLAGWLGYCCYAVGASWSVPAMYSWVMPVYILCAATNQFSPY